MSRDTPLDPPDSPLGQLQRGRGAGALACMAAVENDAHTWLAHCITNDPRWDSQVESRSEQYAELAVHIGLPLSLLREHLFAPEDNQDRDEDRTGLTVFTLADMANSGVTEAVTLLRDYVARGSNWSWALDALANVDDPSAIHGMDTVICDRYPTNEELHEALGFVSAKESPWVHWRSNPRIADLLRTQEERYQELQARTNHIARTETTMQLLERGNQGNVAALKDRTSDEDRAIIWREAQHGTLNTRRAALVALGFQQDLRLLELAEDVLGGDHGPYDSLAISFRRGIRALKPSEKLLATARAWLSSSNEDVAWTGGVLISDYGTFEDLPQIHKMLDDGLQADHIRQMCNAVDALERLGDKSRTADLMTIFAGTPYSYLRKRCVGTMRTEAAFRDGLAFECLWDCEPETRAIACETAPVTAESRARLEELANRPKEDEAVVATARSRLQTGGA